MYTLLDSEFSEINHYISTLSPTKVLILVDENTHQHCLPLFLENWETHIPYEIIELEPGEEIKNIETANQLWEILAEFEADRKSLLINIGGGVITDLGGFVASTYKRGIPFINMPTSLLAMCDASVGGKTGVDLHHFKNMIGVFAEPKKNFIYQDFLKTLPIRELRSGFAEMLKHGLIADKMHWQHLISIEKIDSDSLSPYIEKSIQIKSNVVEVDFYEKNIRKILNFGHTIGHSIESLYLLSGEPIAHGEAVAIGMITETRLAFLENLLDEQTANEVCNHIYRFFPEVHFRGFQTEDIYKLMIHDKKNEKNSIRFSLIDSIGNCTYDKVCSDNNILEAIEWTRNHQNN